MTPILTVAVCIYILSGLPASTWLIFGAWMVVVLLFYFLWGRRHALLNDPEDADGGARPR